MQLHSTMLSFTGLCSLTSLRNVEAQLFDPARFGPLTEVSPITVWSPPSFYELNKLEGSSYFTARMPSHALQVPGGGVPTDAEFLQGIRTHSITDGTYIPTHVMRKGDSYEDRVELFKKILDLKEADGDTYDLIAHKFSRYNDGYSQTSWKLPSKFPRAEPIDGEREAEWTIIARHYPGDNIDKADFEASQLFSYRVSEENGGLQWTQEEIARTHPDFNEDTEVFEVGGLLYLEPQPVEVEALVEAEPVSEVEALQIVQAQSPTDLGASDGVGDTIMMPTELCLLGLGVSLVLILIVVVCQWQRGRFPCQRNDTKSQREYSGTVVIEDDSLSTPMGEPSYDSTPGNNGPGWPGDIRRRLYATEDALLLSAPELKRLLSPRMIALSCITQFAWFALGYFLFKRYKQYRVEARKEKEGAIPLYD